MRCLPLSFPESSGGIPKRRSLWCCFSSEGEESSTSKPAPPPDVSLASKSEAQSPPSPHLTEHSSAAEWQASVEGKGTSSSLKEIRSERASVELQVFTYAELRAIARDFTRASLLGVGGFGRVHKGTLKGSDPHDPQSSKDVAVKLLDRNGRQGHKQWLAEVRFLGLVEHPNLVKLVGYCAEDDQRGIQRLLVYEYMPRGSLEDYLFHEEKPVLSWQQRLQIMLGAARGLTYLHEEMDDGMQVIFRDFKASNILLDEDWTPKLSDFGLARQGPDMGASHVSTSVVGTIGYAAPEYVQTGRLTLKSDIWSFGVVLFEMLTGRRAVDRNRPKNEQLLLQWVRPYLHGKKNLQFIMDPRLQGYYALDRAQRILDLALHCTHRAPKARPSMSGVVQRLKRILEVGESNDSDPRLRGSRAQANGGARKFKRRRAPLQKRKVMVGDAGEGVWNPRALSV